MRLVLDTNVWLDLLVFNDAAAAPIREAMQSGKVKVMVDPPTYAELERVVSTPISKRHNLDLDAQFDCLRWVLRMAEPIFHRARDDARAALPRCGDPDDQKFLDLALAARADLLLTKDRELLGLAGRELPFGILAPQDFGSVAGERLGLA